MYKIVALSFSDQLELYTNGSHCCMIDHYRLHSVVQALAKLYVEVYYSTCRQAVIL